MGFCGRLERTREREVSCECDDWSEYSQVWAEALQGPDSLVTEGGGGRRLGRDPSESDPGCAEQVIVVGCSAVGDSIDGAEDC